MKIIVETVAMTKKRKNIKIRDDGVTAQGLLKSLKKERLEELYTSASPHSYFMRKESSMFTTNM